MSTNLRIGCPFVVISKLPIEDPYNPKNNEFLLLKTEDNTLISFRETFADGTGGENTGFTIELFDPDNLFLLQFIDNNMVKGFESRILSDEGENALNKFNVEAACE